jgi:hypothetical protein
MEVYNKYKGSEDVGWNKLAKDGVQRQFSFFKGRGMNLVCSITIEKFLPS